ncbi:hypothetical protein HK405_001735, partial [Cladochytrium tenue]
MAPIRTAIIGLSSSAATSWAANAHLPYLLSARGRARYQIVALCNSSAESARAAIAHYKLPDPASIRAYGDPAELARDPDVELVVCATRVDVHHRTVRPVLEAGKAAVFCEWPLAQDTAHARDLADLAREKGVKTAVGTQGRLSPVAEKLREVIREGRIGKVLSVDTRAFGGLNGRDVVPTSLAYFLDRKVGGNVFVIGFGHLFDTVQSIVGDISDLHGHLQLQRPDVKLLDRATGAIVGTQRSNVPDLIVAAGSIPESPTTQKDASALLRFRVGAPWPEDPPLVLTIHGEKGELRLTSHAGSSLGVAYQKPVVIDLHDFATDTVERIEWSWEDWQEELPFAARNIGLVYEAFAKGEGYPTFEDAVKRHEQLDALLEGPCRWILYFLILYNFGFAAEQVDYNLKECYVGAAGVYTVNTSAVSVCKYMANVLEILIATSILTDSAADVVHHHLRYNAATAAAAMKGRVAAPPDRSMTRRATVAIVGGGIAGPTLALQLLSHAGLRERFAPVVLDASAAISAARATKPGVVDPDVDAARGAGGAAVAVFPNGLHPLYRLGLRAAVDEVSRELGSTSFWRALNRGGVGGNGTGVKLQQLSRSENASYARDLDTAGRYVARDELRDVLLGAVRERGGEVVEGARVVGVEAGDGDVGGRARVRVQQGSGVESVIEADLVVGADGAWSVIRRGILEGRDPRTAAERWRPAFLGATGFYAIASLPKEVAQRHEFAGTHAVWLQRGSLTTSPLPGRRMRWDLQVPEAVDPRSKGTTKA